MPLNNAFSIPNISRCLKFACDTPKKVVKYATVTPTFREAIIDFKQAEILLNNIKDDSESSTESKSKKKNTSSRAYFMQHVVCNYPGIQWVLKIIMGDAEHLHEAYLEVDNITSIAIWKYSTECATLLLDFIIDDKNQHHAMSKKLVEKFSRSVSDGRLNDDAVFSAPFDEATFSHWKLVFEKLRIIDKKFGTGLKRPLSYVLASDTEIITAAFKFPSPLPTTTTDKDQDDGDENVNNTWTDAPTAETANDSCSAFRDMVFSVLKENPVQDLYTMFIVKGTGLMMALKYGNAEGVNFWFDQVEEIDANYPKTNNKNSKQRNVSIVLNMMEELCQAPGGNWYNVTDRKSKDPSIEYIYNALKAVFNRLAANKILLPAVFTIDHLDYSPYAHFLCENPKLVKMFLDEVQNSVLFKEVDPENFPEGNYAAAASSSGNKHKKNKSSSKNNNQAKKNDDDSSQDHVDKNGKLCADPFNSVHVLEAIINQTKNDLSCFGPRQESVEYLIEFFIKNNAIKQFLFGEVTKDCGESTRTSDSMLCALCGGATVPSSASKLKIIQLALAQLDSDQECDRLVQGVKKSKQWDKLDHGLKKFFTANAKDILVKSKASLTK